MRTRIREDIVYKFSELSDEAKEKAMGNLYNINVDYEWYDSTYEDAERIGLKITEFNIYRGSYAKGELLDSAVNVADSIIKDHGPDCETVQTAKAYLLEFEKIIAETTEDEEPETDDIDSEFLKSLLEDYRIILQKEYEYLTSEEAVMETIQANEYEFTADGKLI